MCMTMTKMMQHAVRVVWGTRDLANIKILPVLQATSHARTMLVTLSCVLSRTLTRMHRNLLQTQRAVRLAGEPCKV